MTGSYINGDKNKKMNLYRKMDGANSKACKCSCKRSRLVMFSEHKSIFMPQNREVRVACVKRKFKTKLNILGMKFCVVKL